MHPIQQRLEVTYGSEARDCRAQARSPGGEGARAALETFYYAFRTRSRAALSEVWAPGSLVAMDNPLGGIIHGRDSILDLYDRIFEGPARVTVEFQEIIEYSTTTSAVFAGRERGACLTATGRLPLSIRTSRFFQYFGTAVGWRQVHHHGSIDDPEALRAYQKAVRGE